MNENYIGVDPGSPEGDRIWNEKPMSLDEFQEINLSPGAQIVGKIFYWFAFSGNCDNMRPSEMQKLIEPIFGKDIIQEVLKKIESQK